MVKTWFIARLVILWVDSQGVGQRSEELRQDGARKSFC